MKKILMMFSLMAIFTSCSPKPADVQKILADNPQFVFKLIEENPEQFIKAVQEASKKSRPQQQKQRQEPSDEIEEGFKNPKNPVLAEDRMFGKKGSPIVIVEYTDFECPFCSRGANTISQLLKEMGEQVTIVTKHLPLPFHKNARSSAQYFEAVRLSHNLAKAHEWSNEIFKQQQKFKEVDAKEFYSSVAKSLKIDTKKVEGVLSNPAKVKEIDKTISQDMAEAQQFGIQGTPGYLINGVPLKGAYPLEVFKQIINRHLKK